MFLKVIVCSFSRRICSTKFCIQSSATISKVIGTSEFLFYLQPFDKYEGN